MAEKRLVGVADVVELTGLSRQTVFKLRKSGSFLFPLGLAV